MSRSGQFDEHHDEGKSGYYRDLLMNEPGNPDHSEKYWIGKDNPVVEHHYQAKLFEESDNEPGDPEQAGWEEFKEGELF